VRMLDDCFVSLDGSRPNIITLDVRCQLAIIEECEFPLDLSYSKVNWIYCTEVSYTVICL